MSKAVGRTECVYIKIMLFFALHMQLIWIGKRDI